MATQTIAYPVDVERNKSSSEVIQPLETEGPSTNTVLGELLCNILLTADSRDEEIKQKACSYLYPSVFRTHEHNREYVKFFLSRGYIDVAKIMGYEHKCWNMKLFSEVFHEFMSSDAKTKDR